MKQDVRVLTTKVRVKPHMRIFAVIVSLLDTIYGYDREQVLKLLDAYYGRTR